MLSRALLRQLPRPKVGFLARRGIALSYCCLTEYGVLPPKASRVPVNRGIPTKRTLKGKGICVVVHRTGLGLHGSSSSSGEITGFNFLQGIVQDIPMGLCNKFTKDWTACCALWSLCACGQMPCALSLRQKDAFKFVVLSINSACSKQSMTTRKNLVSTWQRNAIFPLFVKCPRNSLESLHASSPCAMKMLTTC